MDVEGAEELVESSQGKAGMDDACEPEDFEEEKTRWSSSIEKRLRKDVLVDGLGDNDLVLS